MKKSKRNNKLITVHGASLERLSDVHTNQQVSQTNILVTHDKHFLNFLVKQFLPQELYCNAALVFHHIR